MMIRDLRLFLALVMVLTTSCGTLAPGSPDNPSPYGGDKILFESEQATVTGYELLHAFVTWELNNRKLLPLEVTKAADHVRSHSEEWIGTVNRLHDAYAANPTEENRSALVTGLRVLRQGIAESTAYLVKYGPAHSP